MTVDWVRLAWAAAFYALGTWGAARGLRWARRHRREALLSIGSLAVAGAMAEAALRVARPYESLPRFRWIASARLHHVNPPRRRMFSGYVGPTAVVVETNEDGLRTRHGRASFLRNSVRIVVLGDSFAFGPGVNEPEVFPSRLESHLAQRLGRSDVAVMNAGVISYSPFLQRLQVRELVNAYRPTLVLLLLDVTDIGDDFLYAGKAVRRGDGWEFPLEGDTEVRHYGAVHELLRAPLAWAGPWLAYPLDLVKTAAGAPPPVANYYLNYVPFEGRQENRFFIYRYPLERTAPYFEETFRHIQDVASAVEQANARFGLLVSPRYHHWNPRECPQDWQRGAYGVDEPFQYEYFRFFEQKRPGARFPIVDLLPAFKASTESPLVFPHDAHWNPAGHAFVARTIADNLIASGLVEPLSTSAR